MKGRRKQRITAKRRPFFVWLIMVSVFCQSICIAGPYPVNAKEGECPGIALETEEEKTFFAEQVQETEEEEHDLFTARKKMSFRSTNLVRLKTGRSMSSIQRTLNLAKKYKKVKFLIIVPKGRYQVRRRIHVYDNTTLCLKGVTFVRTATIAPMLVFGSGKKGRYFQGRNITIREGTFDGGTRANVADICHFSHIRNLIFDGCTFRYRPSKKLRPGMRNTHMIEFGGSKNILIKNCRFYNNGKCLENNEAIQIESMYRSMAATTPTDFGKRDGTQCRNVTIKHCYFSGFRYGCGSNHLSKKDRFTNMKFLYNTFVGAKKYAICLFRYHNVMIKGNRLRRCGFLVQNQFSTKVRIL